MDDSLKTEKTLADEDSDLTERLRAGDQLAFRELVRSNHASLVALARTIVHENGIAEEVVQETWLMVIRGLDEFEGRSTLRTWIFAIAVNLAKKRIRKDKRIALWEALSNPSEAESIDRHFAENGTWAKPPARWGIDPERLAEQRQLLELVQAGIDDLPDHQRMVLQLCDVEGFSGPEVCELLDLKASNQRVLLHRARNSVRIYVESHLDES